MNHRENGGTLGMVPLIINPIWLNLVVTEGYFVFRIYPCYFGREIEDSLIRGPVEFTRSQSQWNGQFQFGCSHVQPLAVLQGLYLREVGIDITNAEFIFDVGILMEKKRFLGFRVWYAMTCYLGHGSCFFLGDVYGCFPHDQEVFASTRPSVFFQHNTFPVF